MKTTKLIAGICLLATSLTASAGRFEYHRHYEISVPPGTHILYAKPTDPSSTASAMPGYCTNDTCGLNVIFQKVGDSHKVIIGKNNENHCDFIINEKPHWYQAAPRLENVHCVGNYRVDTQYGNAGIKKFSQFRYGMRLFLTEQLESSASDD